MSHLQRLGVAYYSKNSYIQKSLTSDILKLHNLRIDESILDIGCGDGAISAELAVIAHKGKVLGIDSSSEMIEYAKQNFAIKYNNLYFQHLSANDIDELNQYSLITAFNSLYWIRHLNWTLALFNLRFVEL